MQNYLTAERFRVECSHAEGFSPGKHTTNRTEPMYSIAEKTSQTGSTISRDNCRLWLRKDGETTPCSEEAAVFDDSDEAEEAAAVAGISLGEDSWWEIVDLDDEA